MRDFTYAQYARLVERLRALGYRFLRFSELPWSSAPPEPCVLLRHDVDRLPRRALRLARLEVELGVRATYFFRTRPLCFDVAAMQRIGAAGHELGYHYETLSDAAGDLERAWELFRRELHRFDRFGGVRTIAMHGRPGSPWNNELLWEHRDYRALGLRDAARDLDWSATTYFTDTGGAWNHEANLRDHAPGAFASSAQAEVGSTPGLIDFLERLAPARLVISAHPERWTAGGLAWVQARATDSLANLAKRALRARRGRSAEATPRALGPADRVA